jgi:hypothetical protein
MSSIELNDKPFRNESCQMEELDDEILLYNPTNNKTLYINKSASIIWQLCDGRQSVQDIITMIQEAYPGNEAELESDVMTTLENLIANDAVSVGRD